MYQDYWSFNIQLFKVSSSSSASSLCSYVSSSCQTKPSHYLKEINQRSSLSKEKSLTQNQNELQIAGSHILENANISNEEINIEIDSSQSPRTSEEEVEETTDELSGIASSDELIVTGDDEEECEENFSDENNKKV